MGRIVRMVPKGWEHPKNAEDNFIPMFDNFNGDLERWDNENELWSKGMYDSGGEIQPIPDEYKNIPYSEWDGERPSLEFYMPDFAKEERTHYMMYENTSKGTPLSPPMETPEQLAEWLVNNKVWIYGWCYASYEEWMKIIRESDLGYLIINQSGEIKHALLNDK